MPTQHTATNLLDIAMLAQSYGTNWETKEMVRKYVESSTVSLDDVVKFRHIHLEVRIMLVHRLTGKKLFILFLGFVSVECMGLGMRGGKFCSSYLHLHRKRKGSQNAYVFVLSICVWSVMMQFVDRNPRVQL